MQDHLPEDLVAATKGKGAWLFLRTAFHVYAIPWGSFGLKHPQGGGGGRPGPKAPNMQECDVLPTYATPFTRVPLLFTRGSKDLRPVVCRHYLPHVDTVCLTRSAAVDTTGML